MEIVNPSRHFWSLSLSYKSVYHRVKYCPQLNFYFNILKHDNLEEFVNDDLINIKLSILNGSRKHRIIHDAATFGAINIIKYLYTQINQNNCCQPRKSDMYNVCFLASKYGHLELLKHCIKQEWTNVVGAPMIAAENGHYECLKCLHENGFSWDQNVCIKAVFYGHIECLKYAHQNGCEFDDGTYKHAFKGGDPECIKYVTEHYKH